MISAQDIREKSFDSVRNGYDKEAVDDFLEEAADSISSYQKENAVLKSKMKVLVDKIEEYRSNEEALNQAIISAQKLAVQIENDARSRSAEMLSNAEQKVQEVIGGITEQTSIEEKKLADAKASADKFIDGIRAMCTAQLKNLENIALGSASKPAAPAAKAAPVEDENGDDNVDETVRTIEKSVSRIKPEPEVKYDLSSAMKAPSKQKKNLDSTQAFTL
jgi:cell division initiation protein